jgi:ABC-2 type transport system permease protein
VIAAVRAEFTKLRTIRLTLVALASFALISLAIGGLEGWSVRQAIDTHSPMLAPDFSAAQAGFDGMMFGQLALIVFGVLAVTSEYGGTGMIGVSLLAVPARATYFGAKMVVAALATVLVAVPVAPLAFLATEAALGPHGVAITSPGVPRAMLGAVGYLALMCLLSAGFAALARNPVLPLVILLPLVLTGSQILSAIGATSRVARFLPDKAGMRMLAVHASGGGKLSGAAGFAVLAAWSMLALGAGWLGVRNRDV